MEDLVKLILTVAIVVVVLAAPTMWLWNGLMPDLFGFTEITFWQALGLNVLSSILFKSSGGKSD